MGQDENSGEFQSLNRAVQEAWNRIAPWWDDRVGAEGNDFHQLLVAPATERLLALKPDEVVLDIACGNGQFSRRMADLGARVVAVDFSEAFIDRAKARTQEYAGRIEYLVLDATDRVRLLSLGPRRFDAAICTMALMDMTAIEPLVSTLRILLKPGGRFVFSVMHPCFNSMGSRMVIEEGYQDGNLTPVFAVKVVEYLRPSARQGIGIVGQPAMQYYFHRPLSVLFTRYFEAGFVLTGIEEPAFPPGAERKGTLSWRNYQQIPPVLVARMRLLPTF